MPKEDVVKRLGRVEYIEPNNLFVHSPGDKIQNGIPQPYEDYSLGINLRVITGDRYSCGRTSEGGDIAQNVLEYSSENGTISFMDGTSVGGQGYLTTNFTDISMNNPETNTKECLGIERISIRYDSWYYPTVEITFVDVRGASLMLPSEYEYYNNGGPKSAKMEGYEKSKSDFFRAFFSFPYPMFKLSVKGFYGKEITYDLSVLKCNINFDSNLGNFVVNASFIGFMYGMYADMPFPFIYIAPYINLNGKNTWDEKRRNGDFCYIDTNKENMQGIPMYTFPELKDRVESAGQESDKLRETSVKGKFKSLSPGIYDFLDNKVIKKYPVASSNYVWWSWSDKKDDEVKPGYFFLSIDDDIETKKTIIEDFYEFSKNLAEYNEKVVSAQEELKKCDDYGKFELSFSDYEKENKSYFKSIYDQAEKKLNWKSGNDRLTDDEVIKILKDNIAFLSFTKNVSDTDKENVTLSFNSAESSYGNESKSRYDGLIEELKKRFDNEEVNSPMKKNTSTKSWTILALYVDDINSKSGFVDTSNKIKKKHNEIATELAKLREQDIIDAIGFNPTMRNMYNMVFAHIDTFMAAYYNTLDMIRQSIEAPDSGRTYNSLCGGKESKIEVDVSDNILKNQEVSKGKLPPFTLFYKEETVKDTNDKKYTMIWPGDLNGGESLPEVQLVEAIINATALNRRDFEPVMPKYNIVPKKGNVVPTNYYDIVRGDTNPYLDVLNDKTLNGDNVLRAIIDVFIYRCYYALLNGSYVAPKDGKEVNGISDDITRYTEKAKLIAKLEVENIIRAFQACKMMPPQSFIVGLHKISEDGAKIFAERLSGKNPKFIVNPSNDSVFFNWIKQKDSGYSCLPIGMFLNSVLENYASGLENISLGEYTDKFLKLEPNDVRKNGGYACNVYPGGKYIEKAIQKYGTGEFVSASRLFKNFEATPEGLESVVLTKVPDIPSLRRTSAGITSIFMDPLYYSQKSAEARAYLFLLGIPFGENKSLFLPENVENGDYPTLMLLREGAVYWRNDFFEDPIVYEYVDSNGKVHNVLADIEKNDPCLGKNYALEFNPANKLPKNVSLGRMEVLKRYFLKWVNGFDVFGPSSVTAETPYEITIPNPSVPFSVIEKSLALWRLNGTVSEILPPEAAISAVTNEYVESFANSSALKGVYNVTPGGKLGKIKGNIRTDVFLNPMFPKSAERVELINMLSEMAQNIYRYNDVTGKYEIDQAAFNEFKIAREKSGIDIIEFFDSFGGFYLGYDTVIDYSCFDNHSSSASVPRYAMNSALKNFILELKRWNNVTNEQLKDSEGTDSSGKPKESSKKPEQSKSSDVKLACYQALKNLYDRWLCNRRRESWYFSIVPERMNNNKIKSDFLRFFYIDEFYHDIGMNIRPNLTDAIGMICKEGGFTEDSNTEKMAGISIMKMLSTIGSKAGCSLLTLPTPLGLSKTYTDNGNSIEDVFKAMPYNEAAHSDGLETSFIVLYTSQKSTTLDTEKDSGKNAYKTDGFDIADTWGEIVPQSMLTDGDENSFVIPCFGVTFAKQNQSYFSDIRLSMDNHQITEYSVRNEVRISYQQNTGPRETTILGQDLYSVYSNYSYSCEVTMLGDAQICPLMYFQLNNVPMWKGAYLITNVHHEISEGNMQTVFTGVRQARPTLPYKDDKIDNGPSDIAKETPQSEAVKEGTPSPDTIDISNGPLDDINVDEVSKIVFFLDRTSFATSPNWINGILSAHIFYTDRPNNPKKMDVANTIEATHGLSGRIEDFTPETSDVYFSIPTGIYDSILVENPIGDEYRNPNDTFYNKTGGKHMFVNDKRLGGKKCEIITGETKYDVIESGGFKDICMGGASPIMLYGDDWNASQEEYDVNKQYDKSVIRSTYLSIFNIIKRMNEANKPVQLKVSQPTNLLITSKK